MTEHLMVLPSKDVGKIRVVTVPEDMSPHEAYRFVTGLVSEIERGGGDRWVDDVLDLLEDHGFQSLDFTLGPPLD